MIDADIAALDLDCIAYKVVVDEGWSVERVDEISCKYRAYLHVIRHHAHQDIVAPTKEIDVFWHAHILDTQKYHEDCYSLFGRYLHHYPYSGVFGGEDSRKQINRLSKTMELLEHYLA